MDLREIQRPLKDRYRSEPAASRITLRATGSQQDGPMSCSVEVGRAVALAEAHPGVGGAGTAACSGDLLLGALAACAQITCQMVAAAIGVPLRGVETTVEGDLDLAGTLGLSKEVPVGFEAIRMRVELDAPDADEEQVAALRKLTERYCVVMQTLARPPALTTEWTTPAG
jgi:uncharacterized OsmC-like protein